MQVTNDTLSLAMYGWSLKPRGYTVSMALTMGSYYHLSEYNHSTEDHCGERAAWQKFVFRWRSRVITWWSGREDGGKILLLPNLLILSHASGLTTYYTQKVDWYRSLSVLGPWGSAFNLTLQWQGSGQKRVIMVLER